MNDYKQMPMLPAPPPPGGGFLVLNKSQISCFDLLCAIRTIYPNTKILVQQDIPIDFPLYLML